jgi:hypothetical protein
LDPWGLAAPTFSLTRASGNPRHVNSFVTSPSNSAFSNPTLAGILDADLHIPIWSPNVSLSNGGFQQQAVNTANNGWNLDVSIALPAWNPVYQGVSQSLSHATQGFGSPFVPTLSSVDYSLVDSNAIPNDHPDPTLQFADFGVNNNFAVLPNDFANFNPLTHWNDLTTIDSQVPQSTMTSFNPIPLPTIPNIPAAPALPTNDTSMSAAPAVPRAIAKRVASRRSSVNTNPHTCDYPGCGNIFNRPGDLVRHKQQHGVPQHPCLVHGCTRRGSRAFYRADKLRDHQRKKHRMAV